MASAFAIPLFVLSLATALASAAIFARTLDRLGVRIGLPEALLGLLTALAADGPEIASVIVALIKGATGISLGVVVGSNVFNLAAMFGLTALIAGRIRLRREALVLEGAAGLLALLIAAGVVLAHVPAVVGAALLGCVGVPYLFLLARGSRLARLLPLAESRDRQIARALGEREHWGHHERVGDRAVWGLAAVMIPAVALVVLGSTGMVETAVSLADRWNLPRTIVGVLVLAPLTSIPNAYTAVRLGRARRGAAVVSETLNSNTINLAAGVVVPALFVTVGSLTTGTAFDFASLIVMTVVALLILSRPAGMNRLGGAAMIGLFAAFCIVQVVRA
jgi:cation:H+ antiporter